MSCKILKFPTGHKNARWELCILDLFEARGLHWNRHHGCFVIYGRFIADVNHRVEYGNQEDYAVRKYGMTQKSALKRI